MMGNLPRPVLSCSGLSVRYGGVHAVRGVDLTVHARMVHAVIGPNGAGKSTLINCLTARTFQNIRLFSGTVDAVFFDLHNVRERFDQARTKINNSTIFVTAGNVLYSKSNLPMLIIVTDSLGVGHHDLQFGMCSAAGYALFKGPLYESYRIEERFGVTREQIPDHGCWENLTEALRPWQIPAEDIPSPFNIFQETKIDAATGRMELVYKQLAEPARVELRAERDCLVGLSACPWVGKGLPVNAFVLRDE